MIQNITYCERLLIQHNKNEQLNGTLKEKINTICAI